MSRQPTHGHGWFMQHRAWRETPSDGPSPAKASARGGGAFAPYNPAINRLARITNQSWSRGFTLLEVLLAVTLLGLIIGAVTATWHAGLDGWRRTAGISDSFQRERIVMGTLDNLTKSIVYARSADALYDINFEHDAQTGDSVSFVTGSDLLLPQAEASAAGLRRVTIAMQRDARNRSYLGIANSAALEPIDNVPELVWHALSADVCGFAVRFRDPRDGSMVDKWDESNLLPAAIEYTIGFGANDGRTPPVVVTRTIELPIAAYALELLGQAMSQADTTNTVTTQPIPLIKAPTEAE